MSNKWKLIGFAAFTIVVGSLVLYGVYTHKEAGLIRVCPPKAGTSFVKLGPECPEFKWPKEQLPLDIVFHPPIDAESPDIEGILDLQDRVVKDINMRLGFKLLRKNPDKNRPDIYVEIGTPVSVGDKVSTNELRSAGGRAYYQYDEDDFQSVQIEIGNTGTIGPTYCTAVHEVLHAIGLDHDGFKMSYMYNTVYSEKCAFVQRISDHDKELIRKLYR